LDWNYISERLVGFLDRVVDRISDLLEDALRTRGRQARRNNQTIKKGRAKDSEHRISFFIQTALSEAQKVGLAV
jgi:hypothetical protein